MIYVEVKMLAGMSYIRTSDVLAVQYNDPQRSTIIMAGGVNVVCAEPAKEVMARIEAALAKAAGEPKDRA